MPIGDPDRECVCGGRGCAELYLSGPGLTASARKAGLAVPGGLRDLVSAARAGDPTASAVLGRAGDTLAQWLALILPVVDPDVVVFGGSAGLAIADAVLPVARRRLAITASLRGIGRLPEISVSRCGPGAAATGAALVGLRATEVRGSLATGPLFAAHPNDPDHRGAPA
jgi:predicted NBD/HSP70 family sugar kinase